MPRSEAYVAGLTELMTRSRGRPELLVGLLDGPVAAGHPDLAEANLLGLGEAAKCWSQADTNACRHGTFVAGVLAARRGGWAPGLCPACTLLVRPIFSGESNDTEALSTPPDNLADAIRECVDAGVRLINLSAAFGQPSLNPAPILERALDYAASRRVVVVAAAGNQATIGTSAITRHPAVVPVVAADPDGRVVSISNVGRAIGRRGLAAPGVDITSLGVGGGVQIWTGTSAAAPFVTGTLALLMSMFPMLPTEEVRAAVEWASGRRRSVVPPYLDAAASYRILLARGG